MNTRTVLEQQGMIFHPGYVDDQGIFHCQDKPELSGHVEDLARGGFVKVKGGIMGPKQWSLGEMAMGLGVIGAIGAALWFLTKEPAPQPTSLTRR